MGICSDKMRDLYLPKVKCWKEEKRRKEAEEEEKKRLANEKEEKDREDREKMARKGEGKDDNNKPPVEKEKEKEKTGKDEEKVKRSPSKLETGLTWAETLGRGTYESEGFKDPSYFIGISDSDKENLKKKGTYEDAFVNVNVVQTVNQISKKVELAQGDIFFFHLAMNKTKLGSEFKIYKNGTLLAKHTHSSQD
jgi:hypothetical protein